MLLWYGMLMTIIVLIIICNMDFLERLLGPLQTDDVVKDSVAVNHLEHISTPKKA